jgi:hypothetical protein
MKKRGVRAWRNVTLSVEGEGSAEEWSLLKRPERIDSWLVLIEARMRQERTH